ncbi:hypothetical protein P7C71_g3019, partial [Lecanoromycetidae sp. Uapishka_2]
MPKYAILGTTGKTGGSILTLLLKSPNNTINAYVRSKSKLLSQVPYLQENKSVHIFEGSLTDIDLIASCISNVDAIFSTIGVNENTPGTRMIQDSAQAIVAALCQNGPVKDEKRVPKIIFLSSASLNPVMHAHVPKFVQWFVSTAMSNAYADLTLAMDYLRLHKSWLNVTFIQPGGLVEDEQKGHRLSLEDSGGGFVSYLDLAAGMIEVAQSDGYEWKGVSVVPTSKDVKFEWKAPKQLVRGLVWHYLPSIGWIAKYIGVF